MRMTASLIVAAGILSAVAPMEALAQKHGKRARRYDQREVDHNRYQDVALPSGPRGADHRLLRPRKRGRILIQRTRPVKGDLEREYSTLGIAGRRFKRMTFCTRGCGAGQIDPSVYRKVSLGEIGDDRYLLWVPEKESDPVYVERVVGVTNFADLSRVDL